MSKRHKALMKEAVALTGGFKPTVYAPLKPVSSPDGKVIWLGQKQLRSDCTRYAYQQLKKAA